MIETEKKSFQSNWVQPKQTNFYPSNHTHHRMAAYLQRGFSNVTSNRYDSLVDGNSRQKQNMNSPLQIFVKAKKNINDIFAEISDYVAESTNFIEGLLIEKV